MSKRKTAKAGAEASPPAEREARTPAQRPHHGEHILEPRGERVLRGQTVVDGEHVPLRFDRQPATQGIVRLQVPLYPSATVQVDQEPVAAGAVPPASDPGNPLLACRYREGTCAHDAEGPAHPGAGPRGVPLRDLPEEALLQARREVDISVECRAAFVGGCRADPQPGIGKGEGGAEREAEHTRR